MVIQKTYLWVLHLHLPHQHHYPCFLMRNLSHETKASLHCYFLNTTAGPSVYIHETFSLWIHLPLNKKMKHPWSITNKISKQKSTQSEKEPKLLSVLLSFKLDRPGPVYPVPWIPTTTTHTLPKHVCHSFRTWQKAKEGHDWGHQDVDQAVQLGIQGLN